MIPKVYHAFREQWERQGANYIRAYQRGQQSFVLNLLPQQAVELTADDALFILRGRLGDVLDLALSRAHTDPDRPASELPAPLQSPVIGEPDGRWLRRTNMVGINVRTIHTFWNVVKYALTLPAAQDAIHLLPIWEPGVVQSLYGMSGWRINDEFFSPELVRLQPQLDTVERQLKAIMNLLHALGKTVGMDVIPHTDRYSEMALANPHFFEWLQREDLRLVDHRENLHEEVQTCILDFLAAHGPAVHEPHPETAQTFFGADFDEAARLRVLFGKPGDRAGRTERRTELVKYLYAHGFEPVPATMAPPFRGLAIDPDPAAATVDQYGLVWRDYAITQPELMSRVFGPLARYKLYARRDDNAHWEIDFERPNVAAWDYVCQHYHAVQWRYGFDFMRGDMSHVQMRKDGVPDHIDEYYDLLGTVKSTIRAQGAPYFGYFAESFLAPRDIFGYGEEIDHLEASDADVTLGDLQSTVVGSPEFMQNFRRYYDMLTSRGCAPCFTVMTADKDDPRFDQFYVKGNEVRLFIAFFLADMPSYNSLGFETRDIHYAPVPNEHYTKLYVFHETNGPKARSGPYIWGRNGALYHHVTRLKLYLDAMFARIQNRPTRWLIHPDPTAANHVIAWTQADGADYVFVANLDVDNPSGQFYLPDLGTAQDLVCDFSTAHHVPTVDDEALTFNGRGYRVTRLDPGEGRVYRIQNNDQEE